MDIQKIAGVLLSSDTVTGLSQRSGATNSEVKKVLTQVLPTLLSGADGQAKNADTAQSFASALATHAKDNTGNIGSFLGNVDLEDGMKILGHLLGSNSESTTRSVAKKTGVSSNKTATIMSAAASLLMSLLGQQADEEEDKGLDIGSLMGVLLENVDIGELVTSLLTDDTATTGKKKKKKKKKTASSDSGLGEVLGSILGKLLK